MYGIIRTMAEKPSVDSSGRLVIPKRLRERYGLTAGTQVQFVAEPQGIIIVPAVKQHRRVQRGRIVAIDTGNGIAPASVFDADGVRAERIDSLEGPLG